MSPPCQEWCGPHSKTMRGCGAWQMRELGASKYIEVIYRYSCMFISTYTCMLHVSLCAYVRMHVFMRVYVHAHACAGRQAGMHACICACACAYRRMHAFVHTYVEACIAYTCVCAFVCSAIYCVIYLPQARKMTRGCQRMPRDRDSAPSETFRRYETLSYTFIDIYRYTLVFRVIDRHA